MNSYLIPMDIISIFYTVFKKMPVNILKVTQMAEFDLLKVKVMNCQSQKNFQKPNFARFLFDDVINRAKYFFNWFTRVYLARGQTLPISVQTIDGYYSCCTTVQQ